MTHPRPSRILALADADEEPLVREAARLLRCEVAVVRSRKEFEARTAPGNWLVVGNDQSEAERISTVRRARTRGDGSTVLAAIADKLEMKVELLEAGASFVVARSDPPRRLADGLRAAEEGRCPLAADEVGVVVRRLQHVAKLCVDQGVDIGRCETLTPREREVVALLAIRLSNAEIASQLGIAIGTVKTHVHNILDKLDVEDRALAGVYWRVFDEKRGLRR